MAGVWFKSDRCGIETRIDLIQLLIDILFKSDRCGIETLMIIVFRLDPRDRSNQTVAGLKPEQCALLDTGLICSNQTVAGLKHGCRTWYIGEKRCSNQTVAGLKQ